jgi:D-alanyl-D-alanine carboxypeptidase
MGYMVGKLHAKTGTLSDTSSIAGYIDSKSGNTYAFCIMISDPKSKAADKKMLEEYLIREVYTKL